MKQKVKEELKVFLLKRSSDTKITYLQILQVDRITPQC